MKIKHFIFPAFLIAGTVLLGSCKKNRNVSPDTRVTSHFEVDFNTTTIDINRVDSVTISFNSAGRTEIIKKMQKLATSYNIDNVEFGNDPVNVQIIVYTPKYDNIQGDKPIRTFAYDIAGTTNATINGPTDRKSDTWKPRFIFSDSDQHIRLTISEDQKDPYFSLKADHPQEWIVAHFQKAILDLNGTAIDNALWEATSTDTIFPQGINTIVNTTNFAPYAARIANVNWDQEDIYLLMFNNIPGKYIILHSVYNKR
ncbi:hypothetical protein ACFGVR_06030 [Mucilaginibacter sp. AW1-3]